MPEAILMARVLSHPAFAMLVRGWSWSNVKGLHDIYTVRLKAFPENNRPEWVSQSHETPWGACGEADAELAMREALGGGK